MAQMVDSFGTEYNFFDFKLKYDLEKPPYLECRSPIPADEISDSFAIKIGCGTINISINNMCVWGDDLYAVGDAIDTDTVGRAYRCVDEKYWEMCYDGSGAKESAQQLILSNSGSYLYFGCASSNKVFYTSTGADWYQIGALSGGGRITALRGVTYSGSHYIYAAIGKKLYRSAEGSSTWTDITPSNIYGATINQIGYFNNTVYIVTSNSSAAYYSTNNGSSFTYLYLDATFNNNIPMYLYPYGSYIYVFGNNGRISRISTSNVVSNVYNLTEWASYPTCAATYDSKPFVGLADGKIIYSSDGTGDYGTWALVTDLNTLGFGNPCSMSKETGTSYLWIGTDNNLIVKVSGSSGSYTFASGLVTAEKYINGLYVGAVTYYAGGTTYEDDGSLYTGNGDPNVASFTRYYGLPNYQVKDVISYYDAIFICTGPRGYVYRSTDGILWSLVYDAADSILYAFGRTASYLWVGGNTGLYRSYNGITWSAVTITGMTEDIYCLSKNSDSDTLYIGTASTTNTIWHCTDSISYVVSDSISSGGAAMAIKSDTTPSSVSVAYVTSNGKFGYKVSSTWYSTTVRTGIQCNALALYNAVWFLGFDDGQVWKSTGHSPTFSFSYECTIPDNDTKIKSMLVYGIDLMIGGYSATGAATIYKYVNSLLTIEVEHNIEMLSAITKMYVWNNYIYAGGIDTSNNSLLIRSPDGIRWETVYTNTGGMGIRAIGSMGNYIYIGESHSSAGKIYRSLTGNEWTLVYTSTFALVNDFCFWSYDSYLYVAFGNAATGTMGAIYRSNNGTSWTSVGTTGSTNKCDVNCLCVHGSYLFAGGGGISANNLYFARSSNGTSWTYLHTNISSYTLYTAVYSLASFGSYLYVGCGWSSAADGLAPYWRTTTGSSCTHLTALTSKTQSMASGNALHVTSDMIYAMISYSEVYESDDGTTWTQIHSMSANSAEYALYTIFDNLITAGTRIFYRPLSRIGKYIQKLRNSDCFMFNSCGETYQDKFILKYIEIENEMVLKMVMQGHVIDLWKTFGHYIEETSGYVDYSEDGIYADDFLNKVIGTTCASKFRLKYCPHTLIKIKGEWLSRTQWLYEVARNLSFAINDDTDYPDCQFKATENISGDVVKDKMDVVVNSNGDVFIMPAGTTIDGTDPNFTGHFTKKLTDITDYVWEATKASVNMIEYANAVVLDGNGTGKMRNNYLANPLTFSYSNDFATTSKVNEMSNIVTNPTFSEIVSASVTSTGSSMFIYGHLVNNNWSVPVHVDVYHPSLVVDIDNSCIMQVSVSHNGILNGSTETTFWKEAGLIFGGGSKLCSFNDMYRAVIREERANSTYSYYLRIYKGEEQLASYTLTSTTEIINLAATNYLAVKWYKESGIPTIKVWMDKDAMPDVSTDSPLITLTSDILDNTFGSVGIHGGSGYTITAATDSYYKLVPNVHVYASDFTVSGKTLSLSDETALSRPVMVIRDKSITDAITGRAVAINAFQNASTTKELIIRVDPSVYMWGSSSNRIEIGQWVIIDGKGYYNGEYRVKTIEVSQDKMLIGLDNSKINFSDYVDNIRSHVSKLDSFGV